MPSAFTQSHPNTTTSTRRSGTPITSTRPTTNNTLRRSSRTPRPSARKLAYDAESQESSRAPTPSIPKSPARSKPKPKEKSKKELFGTRGNRPGRITQPTTELGEASNNGSPEPLAAVEPDAQCTIVETQGGGWYEEYSLSREEAIRRATKYLGKDASGLSNASLQKVLDEIEALDEADRASSVGIEGGDTSAQYEPAGRVVLGSGQQSPVGKTTGDVVPQNADALDPQAMEQPALGTMEVDDPPAQNTDTEPEDDDEVVELGPGDSISQQLHFRPPIVLPTITTSGAHPTPSHVRPTVLPRAPRPKKSQEVIPINNKSDTSTVDESDGGTIHVCKRQRLAQQPQPKPPQRSQPLQRAPSSQLGIFRPIASKVSPLPLRAARHIPVRSKPPPTSDVNSALAWAAKFAKQAAESRASTSQGTNTSQDEFGLLAQVLGELESRLADSPLPVKPRVRYPSDFPRSTDFLGDNIARLEAEAALALGKRIRPRNKPTLSDFPGLPRHIASQAIPELIATAMSEGPYETFGTNDEWAARIFKEVAARVAGDDDVRDPPKELRGLMVRRISCFRGEATNRLRPVTVYRYGFINAPTSVEDLQHNINLAKSLLPNDFHCRNPLEGIDPYENQHLREFVAAALYHDPDAIGVVYHQKLKPTPIPSIAFVLTMMQHCIGEWVGGYRIQKDLDAKVQAKMYEAHYLGLLEYEKAAPERFSEFQENLFWYGIDYAGVSEDLCTTSQPVTRAADIRPDSPGTKARKGKARARY